MVPYRPEPIDPQPLPSRPIVEGRVPGSAATYDVTGETARPAIASCIISASDRSLCASAPNTNAAVCRENSGDAGTSARIGSLHSMPDTARWVDADAASHIARTP